MKRFLFILCGCCLCCLAFLTPSLTAARTRGQTVSAAREKVCICHRPPGNPANAHTICIGASAVPAHLRHGDTVGACPVVCDSSSDCTPGQFCKRDEGVCDADAEGVCTAIPPTCPVTIEPVCGCDGTTYDNSCLAAAAGVTIDHAGECVSVTICGGKSGATCDVGQFCKRADGACAFDAEGVCTDIPCSCLPDVDPVCGCDGVTYSSSCFADVAGVAVAATGACVPGVACGGEGGGTCSDGTFCNPAQGDCSPGAAGTCAIIPPVCSAVFAPVCGCDAVTYDNACATAAAGIVIAHAGPCDGSALICGTGGATCGAGDFCSRPEGECAADAAGICTPAPTSCPGVIDPVCGCNGTTYSSACVAKAAGVAVAGHGPCVPDLACGGTSTVTCPPGEFCRRETGCGPEVAGVCTTLPTLCSVVPGEVCGCDGLTYVNACFADAAGVSVASVGACATASR